MCKLSNTICQHHCINMTMMMMMTMVMVVVTMMMLKTVINMKIAEMMHKSNDLYNVDGLITCECQDGVDGDVPCK